MISIAIVEDEDCMQSSFSSFCINMKKRTKRCLTLQSIQMAIRL